MIKKEKTKTVFNTFKDIISSITFAYVVNIILFIVLNFFIGLKLDFGIIVKGILLWTNLMVFSIIDIIIWRYKDEYNYDEYFAKNAGIMLFITSLLLYGMLGFPSLYEPNKKINTETYIPENIIKTNTKIIVIGKTQTLESTSIADLMKKNMRICKDENVNSWNMRIKDTFYICGN